MFRHLVHGTLERLTVGTVTLSDEFGTTRFGSGSPRADIAVVDPAFYRRIVLGGALGAAESYVDGEWECEALTELVRIFAINRDALERLEGALGVIVRTVDRARHALNGNTRKGSRRNIAAHYDLSNEFFAAFLDRHTMYSSAVFEAGDDLDDASERKMRLLCEKLELTADDHLLEVGTGWGGFAVFAATHYGCRVTTTTISAEQAQSARARVAAAGLEDRVEVLTRDYRELEGSFDKIVAIEMVEAVGDDHLDTFFSTLDALLRPGGILVLQAITIEDARYADALRRVDFIKKHVFPGSFIPSVSRLIGSAGRHTTTVCASLEDFAESYAKTLRAWWENVEANEATIRALGFDNRFLRLWRYYLAYCEGGFTERAISVTQLVFVQQGYRGTPWRAVNEEIRT